MKIPAHKDDLWKIHRPVNRIHTVKFGAGDYLHGSVMTFAGVVQVYAQGELNPDGTVLSFFLTKLEFVRNGVVYTRSWDYRFKPRRIVTLADRFASDCIHRQGRAPH